jgi:glycosyltransferase involved in cell wall biosynthesis
LHYHLPPFSHPRGGGIDRTMRQFLYITPYFPPQTQVGALRPLKFVRHLAQHGWQPIVLCDLWPTDAMDPSLEAMVPESVVVVRDYSHRAGPTHARMAEIAAQGQRPKPKPKLHERLLPAWLNNPELLPLGEHSPDMPHALFAARKLVKQYPGIEAIVVNADPFAASLVGARLKAETGLPLIQDFRDIWAPCKLRRPRRPLPLRWVEDKLERVCVEAADHVLINTELSLRDYLVHYPDLPRERFSVLRNHFDAALVGHGSHPGFDRYTLLHLGQFSRFRVADPLVRAVAALVDRGVAKDALQVVSTGAFGEQALQLAEELGVRELFRQEKPVPYHEIGPILHAADLLVMIAEPDADQRIASKFYDYLGARRPMLAISDNPESAEILGQHGAGEQFGHRDVHGMADFLKREMALGRQRTVQREMGDLSSEVATARLAQILDDVTTAKKGM